MSTLVTGIFQAEDQARQAVRHLIKSCVPMDLVRTILPGMRLRLAAHEAEGGHAPKEPGTVMVAVKAPEYVAQRLAVKILREHGAREIECMSAPPPLAPTQAANPRLRIRVSMGNAPARAPVPVW